MNATVARVEPTPVRGQVVTLGTLAEQIRTELEDGAESWRQAQDAMSRTLARAIRAGELLTQAKEQCAHGEWLPWLAENFEFGDAQARKLMKVSRERAHLHDLPGGGLEAALHHLARKRAGELPEQSENGHARAKAKASDAALADGDTNPEPVNLPYQLHLLLWDDEGHQLVDRAGAEQSGHEIAELVSTYAAEHDGDRLLGRLQVQLATAAGDLAAELADRSRPTPAI